MILIESILAILFLFAAFILLLSMLVTIEEQKRKEEVEERLRPAWDWVLNQFKKNDVNWNPGDFGYSIKFKDMQVTSRYSMHGINIMMWINPAAFAALGILKEIGHLHGLTHTSGKFMKHGSNATNMNPEDLEEYFDAIKEARKERE